MLAKNTKWISYYRCTLKFIKWTLDLFNIAGHQEYKLWGRRDSSDSFFHALGSETMQQNKTALGKASEIWFTQLQWVLCPSYASASLCALQNKIYSYVGFMKFECYFLTRPCSCVTGTMAGNYRELPPFWSNTASAR